MNEQTDKLHDALADLLTKATQTAGQAKDFALAQAPDVIQQLLTWKLWENVIIGGIVLGFIILVMKKLALWRTWIIDEGADEISWIPWTLSLLITIGIGCFGISCLIESAQVLIAPKVYLLEYAKGLIAK